MQKTLIASVLGGLTLFLLGYLIYVIIMPSPEWAVGEGADTVAREYIPGIIIFEIVYGFILAYVYGKWAGIKTFSTGMKEGAVLGLLLGLVAALWMYSTTTMVTEIGVLWWVVTFMLRFAVAGGVVGWFLGRGATE